MADHLRKSKVGLFGGTFDPIHLGHLNLAIEVLEREDLDRVLFCPANYSPEKGHATPQASGKQRQTMVQLAIEDIPEFFMTHIEINREGPSYTIETVQELLKKSKDVQYFLLLGEDTLMGLSKWKDVEMLLEMAPPIVATRANYLVKDLPKVLEKATKKKKCEIPAFEISSTLLRKRLARALYCGHLIPAKAYEYIMKHHLYG